MRMCKQLRVALALAVLWPAGRLATAQMPSSDTKPWWQRGADTWHYKDDWKARAVTPVKGGREPAVSKTIPLPSPAISGWIVVWGDRGYGLRVNSERVGASVDGCLIDDYDLSKLVAGKRQVVLRIDGRNVAAEGEIVDGSGRPHAFATGPDWQGAAGGGVKARPIAAGPSTGAYHRAHNGRLVAYNAEQRAKAGIAKCLARIQRLNEQGVFGMRRLRPAGEVLAFRGSDPWRRAEALAGGLAARARAVLKDKAIPAELAGRHAEALAAAEEAGVLLAAAEAPIRSATAIYRAERSLGHLRRALRMTSRRPGSAEEELAGLLAGARRDFALGDWAAVDKAARRAGELLARARRAAEAGGDLVGGLGQPDAFPEDRFAWLNAAKLMGSGPADWPFAMLASGSANMDLAGRWDFRLDPNNEGEKRNGHAGAADGWRKVLVPLAWERQGFTDDNRKAPDAPISSQRAKGVTGSDKPYNGFAWYRKRVVIPEAWKGRALRLTVGKVSNWARLFVNGKAAGVLSRGGEGRRVEAAAAIDVPAEAVAFGKPNVLTLHVYNHDNFGGIVEGPVAIHCVGGRPDVRETPGPLSRVTECIHSRYAEVRRQTFLAGAMSPAVLVADERGILELWGWEAKGYPLPERLTYPAPEGEVTVRLDRPAAVRPRGAWLHVAGGPTNAMLVFESPPTAVEWKRTDQGPMGLTIHFGTTPARAAVLNLPAAAKIDAEKRSWWARVLRKYPVTCSEIVRRRPDGRQECTLAYDYYRLGDPNAPAVTVAPVPMLASYALASKFPGLTVPGAKATGYRSQYAAWRVVPGAEGLTYTAPAVDRSKVMKGVGELFAKMDEKQNSHAWGDEAGMFRRMAGWGFDHCRYAFAFQARWDLPLCRSMEGPILEDNEAAWRRLDEVVRRCNDAGMQMMLTWFSDTGTRRWTDRPSCKATAYELWRRLARRYKHLPAWAISYDFFNEPAYMNTGHYNRVMKELTAVVRSEDKTHAIVWESGDGWAQPFWCLWMEPVADDNVIYSFHHYGKHWGYAYDEYYPGYQATRERTQIDPWLEAILFGIKHNAAIHCGEFGLSMIQPAGDGERWLNDYLALFERFGIGWNWWNYSGRDVYRTGLIARDRVSPYVPILTKWSHRSGWGKTRRTAAGK